MNLKPFVLRLALVFAALTACGCEGYYSAYPGYGPYYGGSPYYGSPGSVTIAVGDRPDYMLAAPVTGTEAPIMSGGRVIGYGGMVSKFGSTATMWCEDTRARKIQD